MSTPAEKRLKARMFSFNHWLKSDPALVEEAFDVCWAVDIGPFDMLLHYFSQGKDPEKGHTPEQIANARRFIECWVNRTILEALE